MMRSTVILTDNRVELVLRCILKIECLWPFSFFKYSRLAIFIQALRTNTLFNYITNIVTSEQNPTSNSLMMYDENKNYQQWCWWSERMVVEWRTSTATSITTRTARLLLQGESGEWVWSRFMHFFKLSFGLPFSFNAIPSIFQLFLVSIITWSV